MPAPLKNRAIMVLGMHRSGTSAFTGVLSLMGVNLGQRLLPASSTNPSGHWEHEEVVSVHDSLFMALGTKWDDPRRLPAGWLKSETAAVHRKQLRDILSRDFAGCLLWALKDPRLCKVLPLWIPLLEELECDPVWVLMARNPAESIRSLENREGFLRQKSELLWLRYTLDAAGETKGRTRVVITFDQLLEDWEETLRRVQWAAGLPWPVPLEQARKGIEKFLDSDQRHYRALEAGEVSELTRETYEGLLAGARGDEEKMRGLLDRTRAAFDAAEDLYCPIIDTRLGEANARYTALREKYRLSKEKLAAKSGELKARKEQVREFERSAGGKLTRFLKRFKWKR
jgi:hypothetical protein